MFLGGDVVPLGFSAHAATLAAPYPDWRKRSFTKSFQKYLARRKSRFLKSGDVVLEHLTGDAAAEAVYALRDLRAGRFEGDPIQSDAVADFYAAVARNGASEGLCRLYRLSHDGRSVAYTFSLTQAGRLHYLLIGCDYGAFSRHSPGLLLYDMMMETFAEEGGRIFDFTIGDEAFKADFATVPTAMYALLSRPTVRGRIAHGMFGVREHARRLYENWRGGGRTGSTDTSGDGERPNPATQGS
ncbi:GNAT family N-acetyltransferase [Aureimonas sp. SA4125]|uniref:GNAT family N-acetyltransferase n=1 Tax=Aureimonas sp. SA4125 TaxID=2826993 RepID=UPI001CC7430C|nr:GNAT family N-acetyltransferase [Aureimonas sp. SA4125]